jgi:hypothetical protein
MTYFERAHPKHFTAFRSAAAEIAAKESAQRDVLRRVLSLKLAKGNERVE